MWQSLKHRELLPMSELHSEHFPTQGAWNLNRKIHVSTK